MIYLYNDAFSVTGKLKMLTKKLLNKNIGGPSVVFNNLVYGLWKRGYDVEINSSFVPSQATVCVINGVAALQWAIKMKKRAKIKKILAGPNIALPTDFGGIILSDVIDMLLVPAPWVADFCLSYKPELKEKIQVWAAGVQTVAEQEVIKSGTGKCVLYQKNGNAELLSYIERQLDKRHIRFTKLVYGFHSNKQYIEALKYANFAIMLSESESQGMALHEAWMTNTPTFVWNGGHMVFKQYEWTGSSPAPYLTSECGHFFNGVNDFNTALDSFLLALKKFSPRAYHLKNFTPEITAEKYMSIFRSL